MPAPDVPRPHDRAGAGTGPLRGGDRRLPPSPTIVRLLAAMRLAASRQPSTAWDRLLADVEAIVDRRRGADPSCAAIHLQGAGHG